MTSRAHRMGRAVAHLSFRIFSPIVLVILAAQRAGANDRIVTWTLAAAAVQFLVYSSYAVWWGGYSYGPIWIGVVVALYPLCRWYAGVKARSHARWLSYL
jgi:hypothetical protein